MKKRTALAQAVWAVEVRVTDHLAEYPMAAVDVNSNKKRKIKGEMTNGTY